MLYRAVQQVITEELLPGGLIETAIAQQIAAATGTLTAQANQAGNHATIEALQVYIQKLQAQLLKLQHQCNVTMNIHTIVRFSAKEFGCHWQ